MTRIEQRIHQGPIPDPDTLAGYNAVVPDAAERILRMAEDEAAHRQALEKDAQGDNIKDRLRARREILIGQIFAFLLCSLVVVAGAYVAVSGEGWPGTVLGATGLSGIILAYLKRK